MKIKVESLDKGDNVEQYYNILKKYNISHKICSKVFNSSGNITYIDINDMQELNMLSTELNHSLIFSSDNLIDEDGCKIENEKVICIYDDYID